MKRPFSDIGCNRSISKCQRSTQVTVEHSKCSGVVPALVLLAYEIEMAQMSVTVIILSESRSARHALARSDSASEGQSTIYDDFD